MTGAIEDCGSCRTADSVREAAEVLRGLTHGETMMEYIVQGDGMLAGHVDEIRTYPRDEGRVQVQPAAIGAPLWTTLEQAAEDLYEKQIEFRIVPWVSRTGEATDDESEVRTDGGVDGSYRHVVMISAEPRGLVGPGRTVWVVYRNRYPREKRGFFKSILGIGDKYNRIAVFEDREKAIEYGLDAAEPGEKVTLSKKHGGQITLREPNNTGDNYITGSSREAGD